MQMSLEAITMLMRFHHRSCCSGIRGIFHPYLENNCELRIGDTLSQCSVSFHFGIWSELDRRSFSLCTQRFICSPATVLLYFQLFICLMIACQSPASSFFLLISQSNSSSCLQTCCMLLHVSTQMTVIVYTIKHNFMSPRWAVRQDKETCSIGAASVRSGAKPVARHAGGVQFVR